MVRDREGERKHDALVCLQFVHLLNVNGQPASRIQPPWTHPAFEMLRLLVLHQDYEAGWPDIRRDKAQPRTFFILKLTLAVPAPGANQLCRGQYHC